MSVMFTVHVLFNFCSLSSPLALAMLKYFSQANKAPRIELIQRDEPVERRQRERRQRERRQRRGGGWGVRV